MVTLGRPQHPDNRFIQTKPFNTIISCILLMTSLVLFCLFLCHAGNHYTGNPHWPYYGVIHYSDRGFERINFGGYSFGILSRQKNNRVIWRCTGAGHNNKRCLAVIHSSVIDQSVVVKPRKNNHICIPKWANFSNLQKIFAGTHWMAARMTNVRAI